MKFFSRPYLFSSLSETVKVKLSDLKNLFTGTNFTLFYIGLRLRVELAVYYFIFWLDEILLFMEMALC